MLSEVEVYKIKKEDKLYNKESQFQTQSLYKEHEQGQWE